MATSTPPTDPDSLAVLHALSREDLSPEDAYNALEGIRHMAGHAVTTILESHRAILESHRAEINAKIDALRWVIGLGLAGIGLLMTVLRLFT